MIATTVKYALLALSLWLVAGCSLAPLTPRVDAASVGKNKMKIETNFAPAPSLGFIYGVSKNLDVGLEIERAALTTAWTRYSFINNLEGLSFAGNAAVFDGSGDEKSNGWYAGLLLSNQFNPSVRWSAGARYAVLDYEWGQDFDSSYFNSLWTQFDDPNDASHNAQLEFSMSWWVKPHLELALGANCQYLLRNTNPERNDRLCRPILGMSFYRL